MAAGAVHTPQILQLTGIGPADLLEGLGIPITLIIPGLGHNFQDDAYIGAVYQCIYSVASDETTLTTKIQTIAILLR
jgi:choline dehydrogenase